jgi:hypothetical protein
MGTLRAKEWGKGTFPELLWNLAGEPLAGVGAHAQQPGVGKLVRVAEGGKLHRRGGKTHFPHEL